jgi:hypothetical protein
MWEFVLDSSGTGQGPVADSSEHKRGAYHSLNGGKYIVQLSSYRILDYFNVFV